MFWQAVIAGIAGVVASSPIVSWLVKRFIGKRLDDFDRSREEARTERAEREREEREWQEAMTAGMRSMLRSELISEHRKAHEQGGWCSLESKEYVERTYNAYHSLGGNGIGTSLYEEIMALPSKPRE